MTGLFTLAKVALVVAVVGAVDWLWIGLFKYNFIAAIFGSGSQPVTSTGERIIYIAFGAGGIIALLLLAAGPRRVVTARPDRDVQRNEVAEEQRLREEHGLGDYSEYRDYQAWKAEKARLRTEQARTESDRTDAEAAQAKQDE
jgi:uncharacterized membrane protein YuzA (DUF378 family)